MGKDRAVRRQRVKRHDPLGLSGEQDDHVDQGEVDQAVAAVVQSDVPLLNLARCIIKSINDHLI